MAQPNFGTVGPFNPAVEDWISYEERFGFYLTANDMAEDDKKLAIFLTTCGTRDLQFGLQSGRTEEAIKAYIHMAGATRAVGPVLTGPLFSGKKIGSVFEL